MHIKCPHCGTVNWANAEVCVRCRLSADQPVETRRSYHVEAPAEPGSASGKFIVGGFVLVVAVCGYIFLSSGSKPAANQAAANANVGNAPAVKAMTAEDIKKEFEAQLAKDPRNQPMPSGGQLDDWKKKGLELGKKSVPNCRMTGTYLNPSTGGYSPVMQCN